MSGIYNLIILDIMLPEKDGYQILKEIRENNIDSKIIMLTVKSQLEDKLIGFNNGADDYITKPFHIEELLARVNVQLRKNNNRKIFIILTVILTSALTWVSRYASSQINTSNQSEMSQNNNSNSNVTYTSATEITEDKTITEGTYDSKTAEENTISVDGDINVDLENLTVTKSGDSTSGDNSNFYGTNSAIIAKNKANLTLKNITVNTTVDGANGVFSYGGSATTNNSSTDNTTVNISEIKLTGDSYVTSLDDEDTTYSNIDFNGYKLYVNNKVIN